MNVARFFNDINKNNKNNNYNDNNYNDSNNNLTIIIIIIIRRSFQNSRLSTTASSNLPMKTAE
jgi:hypothetical protein